MNPRPCSLLLAVAAMMTLALAPAPAARRKDDYTLRPAPMRPAREEQAFTQLKTYHAPTGQIRGAQRGALMPATNRTRQRSSLKEPAFQTQRTTTAKTTALPKQSATFGQSKAATTTLGNTKTRAVKVTSFERPKTKGAAEAAPKKKSFWDSLFGRSKHPAKPTSTETHTTSRIGQHGDVAAREKLEGKFLGNAGSIHSATLPRSHTATAQHKELVTGAAQSRHVLPRGGEQAEDSFHSSTYTRRHHVAQQTLNQQSPWTSGPKKTTAAAMPLGGAQKPAASKDPLARRPRRGPAAL